VRWTVKDIKAYCQRTGRPLPEGLPEEDEPKKKYGNKKVCLDGYEFDSQKEANRYCELKLLVRVGEITDLKVHPEYVVWEGARCGRRQRRVIKLVPDFEYIENGQKIVEDVKTKPTKTRAFMLKLKLFREKYPDIEFRIYE
jgi:hypothetical protein